MISNLDFELSVSRAACSGFSLLAYYRKMGYGLFAMCCHILTTVPCHVVISRPCREGGESASCGQIVNCPGSGGQQSGLCLSVT